MPKHVPPVAHGPRPIGPYSVATEAGGLVFVSGQIGLDPATGKLVEGGVVAEAARIMENLGLILGDLGLGFADVVKTTVLLADIADFAAVNGVYGRHFGAAPPARSTFQVGALPAGCRVEVEVIAAR